jgi:succinate dehydrogenase/fumarate reductase cytochrome b subunit
MPDESFSSRPMRSESAADKTGITVNPVFGPLPSPIGAVPKITDTDLLRSPAMRHEVNALMDEPSSMPDQLTCELFPPETPLEARRLGSPLAFAKRNRLHVVFRVLIRIIGWIILINASILSCFSIIGFLSGLTGFGEVRFASKSLILTVAAGMMVAAAFNIFLGIRLAIIRKFARARSCWFSPGGVVWLTGNKIEWSTWEQLPAVYFREHPRRPALGLPIENEINWFPFRGNAEALLLPGYLERRASAERMPSTLQAVVEGQIIQFGEWRLSQFTIQLSGTEFLWKQVAEVINEEKVIVIQDRAGRCMRLAVENIPFPSLFFSLARGLHSHWNAVRKNLEKK